MSASGGVVNNKLNVFWICLLLFVIQEICDTCIQTKGCHHYEKNNWFSCFRTLPWSNSTGSSLERELNIDVLELCGIKQDILDLTMVAESFSNVTNVTIVQGHIRTIKGNVSFLNKLQILRLSNLTLEEFPDNIFKQTQSLSVFDITGNCLKTLTIKAVTVINQYSHHSFLAGNHWDCSLDLEWALQLNASVVRDLEDLKCYEIPYPGKPVVAIARIKHNVRTNCPAECECSLPDVVRDPSNLKLIPIIEVNCSDRGLTELPSVLPTQTQILILERNNIESLEPLVKNPLYRGIQDLYLDSNYIGSIEQLESSYWLAHFRVLSLSNNKLTQLPTYALDNALQRNPNMPVAVRIYFGNNPWRCDCVFTPGFQEILQKYETQIRDIDDIKCAYVEGDENSLTLISELSRSSVCRLPNEYSIRVLDLLNGILATLIVLILGKLAYDYYHFKKTGRLPWIVTKMP